MLPLRARPTFAALCLAAATVSAAACTDNDTPNAQTGGSGGQSSGAAGPGGSGGDGAGGSGLPSLAELEDGWNEIQPGGDTICARGTEYAFFVHPGTVDKVVIDFIGGGACWDAFTCGIADAIFNDSVDPIREAVEQGTFNGIYDRDNPDNPFRDWHHVVLPYCTGDIHWGDATTDYGSVQIEHRGAVNSRAVLDWVYDNYAAPEQIFVTGCSAGSYGSALWASHVMEHYQDTQVIQFGDSGAGVITETFFQNSFPSWNAEQAFPSWIPSLNPARENLLEKELADLYIGIADHYPSNFMSQYNTVFDENQFFYFQAMGGGTVDDWSAQMLSSLDTIEQNTDNYASFVAPGEQHCIVLYDNFYTVNADGTTLVDWLGDLLENGSVANAKCTDCSGPTP